MKSKRSVGKIEKTNPANSPIDHILHIQRTIGNQAVQGLFESGMIQTKLLINQPGDKYEQVAEEVMNGYTARVSM